MRKLGGLIIVLAIAAAFFFAGRDSYRKIESSSNELTAEWEKVESACQRRCAIVPELIASSRESFPDTLVIAVLSARENAATLPECDLSEESILRFYRAQTRLVEALDNLMAQKAEALPQEEETLPMEEESRYAELESSLEANEILLEEARCRFNTASDSFNSLILKFPTNMVAAALGYTQRGYLPE